MSWVAGADGSAFPVENLPYGVFTPPGGNRTRIGVAIGPWVLDLKVVAGGALAERSLDAFLALGPAGWQSTRDWVTELVTNKRHRPSVEPHLLARDAVRMHLPFTVADYVDFYSSPYHAANVGRIFRPDGDPLTPNWKHLPIGYHGRSGTVVVSGTPVVRPCGQRLVDGVPAFGPSLRLDVEAEVGFVVGVPSRLGSPVPVEAFRDHVFGVCLVNDWSARDIQAWEYVPLGPFLGKSFATSVSPWVVPLAALEAARVPPPPRDPEPLPYLRDAEDWGLDLALEIERNGTVVSRPPFATTYWTPAQQLAHLTSNGASVRTGDLFASGTVSGPEPDQVGSLLELGRNDPAAFLADGDTVTIRATAPGSGGGRISLGEVTGNIHPAITP